MGLPRASCLQLPSRGLLARLRELPAPPQHVWIAGEPPVDGNWLAIWGTRSPTDADILRTHQVVTRAASLGVPGIITGLSPGVDVAAAEAAVGVDIGVVGVIAGGHDELEDAVPESLALAVIAGGGTIVSLQQPGRPITPARRRERDPVQAALCTSAIVVASEADCGAIHCARQAIQLGRLVVSMDDRTASAIPEALQAHSPTTAVYAACL